jgi:exodeoxyribonuclease-3
MKIITVNVNGIRSAARKDFFTWMLAQNADIICLQEVRAKKEDLVDPIFYPKDYFAYFSEAKKPGYSGTAIYTRHRPDEIIYHLKFPLADDEGRYIQINIGNLSVASLYMPSGSSGDMRQQSKFEFMKKYAEHLERSKEDGREHIICGDWNIVHKEMDIKNFKGNQKNSGCLPEERAWLDGLLTKRAFHDAFRVVDQRPEQYTWWSNRGQAWAKNVGWRIDYQIITPGMVDKVKAAHIFKDLRFSDHAPLIVDYNV